MQSKAISALEVMINILIGFAVSYFSTFFILPLAGLQSTPAVYFEITVYYTFISIVRMYALRRWFNGPFHVWLMRFENDNYKKNGNVLPGRNVRDTSGVAGTVISNGKGRTR